MILYKNIVVPDNQELYIVGDLHGSYSLYKQGEYELGITNKDCVISLGDLIDRGNENYKCVIEFTDKQNRYAIKGNHEDMMVKGLLGLDPRYYHCWVMNGGVQVLEEMPLENEVECLAQKLDKLPVILTAKHRGKTLAFVHAEWPSILEHISPIDAEKEIKTKHLESLLWNRDLIDLITNEELVNLKDVPCVDYIFHGHTVIEKPVIYGNRVYMDTGGCFNGKLTFAYFQGDDLEFYTTNQRDE